MIKQESICKLCNSTQCLDADVKHWRKYTYCPSCDFLFVNNECWITSEEELHRYNLHNNEISNTGYVSYLMELKNTITDITGKNDDILDFGCGKNAVLSELLRNDGYYVDSYDPLFNMLLPDVNKKYEVIILCEVVEHIRNLQVEIKTIRKNLKDSGMVFVRTRLFPEISKVPIWWYAQDKTHINFFSLKSLSILAEQLNLHLNVTEKNDVFILA